MDRRPVGAAHSRAREPGLGALLPNRYDKHQPEETSGRVFHMTGQTGRRQAALHYFADMTAERIATERGLPAGTVKARLAAGRRRLERELAADRQEARDAR
jgi:DNA-directed RNA polymerase specialized sigma24 family protein